MCELVGGVEIRYNSEDGGNLETMTIVGRPVVARSGVRSEEGDCMNKARPTRRSIRLPGFDYSQSGAYFVTICTYRRQTIFGWVRKGAVELDALGAIAEEEWLRSVEIRAEIDLDEYVVMPNHLHGIVVIEKQVGLEQSGVVGPTGRSALRRCGPVPRSLGAMVAGYKSAVTKRIHTETAELDLKIWQRNYCERVIRNERELNAIRRYIQQNPRRWGQDSNHIADG
jgi:REP element-mobilizing transposase RayT